MVASVTARSVSARTCGNTSSASSKVKILEDDSSGCISGDPSFDAGSVSQDFGPRQVSPASAAPTLNPPVNGFDSLKHLRQVDGVTHLHHEVEQACGAAPRSSADRAARR